MQKYSDIKNAIQDGLNIFLNIELKKEVSKMDNPNEKKIANKKVKLEPAFKYETWIKEVQNSLNFMMEQNLSFATHISKGIHSGVKSDNLIYIKKTIPTNVYASSSCINCSIDANSNNTGSHAGHLKEIINFLNISYENKKIFHHVIDSESELKNYLVETMSNKHYEYLKNLLTYEIKLPKTDERNKQLLFPTGIDNYTCIVPLYPSSMTNFVFKKINEIRYSDESKTARANRKEDKEPIAYKDILNLAVLKIGGKNAQNVSRFNNEQSGLHYLLPSLPPPSIAKNLNQQEEAAYRPSKFASSIFEGKQLVYECQKDIKRIFNVVSDSRNTVDVRDKRKEAMDAVLHNLFRFADYMRTQLPAGWTKDYELRMHQKLWLDPMRTELKGEEDFASQREEDAWINEVINDFASWMNALLKAEFSKYKADFADAEFIEWEREIEDMKKSYERAGKGVFL